METPKVTDWIAIGIAGFAFIVSIVAVCYSRIQTKIAKRALVFSRSSARSAETSAKTAEKAVREGFRPYVVVKLFCLDTILHFEIVNLGNRTAKDVTVTINPSFDDLLPLNTFNVAVKGVSKLYNQKFISAGHSLTTLLAKNEEYLVLKKDIDSDVRRIEIKYNSVEFTPSNEKQFEFEDKYEIDIRSFLFSEKVATTSDNRQLGKVTSELKKMNTSLYKISSSISKDSNDFEDGESIT